MSEGMGAVASVGNAAQSSVVPASLTKGGPAPHAQNKVAPDPKHQSTVAPKSDEPRRLKVKVDGQEMEVDESELISGYQKAKASDKRFQEAAQQAKQANEILSALESGDIKFIEKKLGKAKAKELFENYLIEDMEYEQLSPAEKRALELENENKSLKQQQEEAKKRAQDYEKQQHYEKAQKEIDDEMHQALSELGMKPTPRLAVRIVDEMIARLEGKNEAITAKDASAKAIAGLKQDIAEILPTLSLEQLKQVIPQSVIDQLRQSEVDRVLGERSQRRTKPVQRAEPKPSKPVGVDDYFKKLEQKFQKRSSKGA